MAERKAIIKNADMSEDMQQDAVDCASQVSSQRVAMRVRWQRDGPRRRSRVGAAPPYGGALGPGVRHCVAPHLSSLA